jgi:hypothetical protein
MNIIPAQPAANGFGSSIVLPGSAAPVVNSAGKVILGSVDQLETLINLHDYNLMDKVLLKFTFSRPEDMPKGIERVNHIEGTLDAMHIRDAHKRGEGDLAERGRVREGKVDTGARLVNGLKNMQVAALRRGFASNGFYLTNIHSFVKKAKQRFENDKYVVVVVFQRRADVIELSSATTEQLRELAKGLWGFCYVWQNPHDKNITINLGGFIKDPNVKMKHALVCAGGHVCVKPAQSRVEEANE